MGQSKEKDKHFGISDYLRRKICVLSIVEPSAFKTGHPLFPWNCHSERTL